MQPVDYGTFDLAWFLQEERIKKRHGRYSPIPVTRRVGESHPDILESVGTVYVPLVPPVLMTESFDTRPDESVNQVCQESLSPQIDIYGGDTPCATID